MTRNAALTLLVVTLLAACLSPPEDAPQAPPLPTAAPTETPARQIPTPRYDLPPPTSPTVTAESTSTDISTDPDNAWMSLPVLPSPGENVREIYELGQTLGNDPNAFSIFGDCQTMPEEFFGVFETDPLVLQNLSTELRGTAERFNGSFNRESPTAQDGTTPGALLWDQWHRGQYGCTFAETPVSCELRLHRPSFVIIQIGTHFESRNTEYLRKIITQLIDNGVAPILATKADNRELDHRVNRDMALLANEFNLPLWNFWASLNNLPNRGLYTRNDRPLQGDIYLTEEAQEIQRRTGLEALNIVWRMATGK